MQEEHQYHKMHQKQLQEQQDSAWMHSVPEWHDAELVGQNKPWTVPSQLLTPEEEVRPRLCITISTSNQSNMSHLMPRQQAKVSPGGGIC